jgi:type IV secretion system protein VirB10
MQGPIASESTAELVAQTREQLARYKQELLQRQAELRASVGGAGLGASPTLVAAAPGAAAAPASVGGTSAQGGILDGSLKGSATTRVRAGVLGNRSLMLPRGSSFTCALKNRVISAQAGFVGCQVMRDVFSDNGKVLLVPRGSHLDGEYKVTQVRPGTTRIPVLWTRLRTPDGVTVDLDSPATGGLGESGSDAYVDNRWIERIGAALLVSVIEDSINIVVNNSTAPPSGSNTVVFQGTAQTASKMAEKVLDSTVNLPPLMYQNQGGIVGVYIAHDIDFSSVYELQPVAQ